MSEELNVTERVQETENTQENNTQAVENSEANQISEIELKAREMGWKPKEEFKGDGTWRDAREFVERGELLSTISSLNSQVKGLKYHMEDLLTRNEKREIEKETAELKKLRRTAIDSADAEGVEQLDKEIEKNQEIIKRSEAAKNRPHPAITDFIERNKDWYNNESYENSQLVKEAEKISNWARAEHPHWSVEEELSYVENQIKKKRSNSASRQATTKPVESSQQRTASATSKNGYSSSQVTSELKRIAHDFVARGIFKSTDDYYKAYFSYNGDK